MHNVMKKFEGYHVRELNRPNTIDSVCFPTDNEQLSIIKSPIPL